MIFPPFVAQYYAQGNCFGACILVLGESYYAMCRRSFEVRVRCWHSE